MLLGGLVVGFWFVPNDFYIGYGYAALSGAFVFALVQGFCLLGVADKVNGAFVARMEESEGRGPFVALLLLTLTAFGAALALASLVLAYYRAPLPGYHTAACAINSFFGAFAIATAAAVAVLSVLPVVQAHRPKARRALAVRSLSAVAGALTLRQALGRDARPPADGPLPCGGGGLLHGVPDVAGRVG